MPAPEKIAALRHLIAERFPCEPRTAGRALATGIPIIDQVTGGLPLGAITELVCTTPSSGGHLFLSALLTVTRTKLIRTALVDATDSFDPSSFEPETLEHLLWVRCRSTAEALQVVDLLARDANLGLVLLDLCHAREADLRCVPATQWYRLQRAVEPADLALVVETPRSIVPSAQLRLELETPHPSPASLRERHQLEQELTVAVLRQRLQLAVPA